jgi:bacteriocin biosynthesis cyclodehydratase domain-containing protein
VVLAPAEQHPLEQLEGLLANGVAHLLVRSVEAEMQVGPLVLPGETPCVHCADLRRSEQDESWPGFLSQLGRPRPGQTPPCDNTLAGLAAGYAVLYALNFLDGGTPPVIGAVTSLTAPDAALTRSVIDAHPECACGAVLRKSSRTHGA